MELDPLSVEELCKAQVARIGDPAVSRALRQRLVAPRPCQLDWEYGEPGEHYLAFVVAEFLEKNTGIAYSNHGFGPGSPWGVISLERFSSGMDADWFASLEGAYRASGACPVPPPPGYEAD